MQNNDQGNSFPGYPHYPAADDINKNNNGKQQLKEDAPAANYKTDHLRDGNADTRFVGGTDADVTAEDLKILDAAGDNMNTMDSNGLQYATLDNVDDDGDPLNEEDELDVPGSEEDDANEAIGEEDEENNYYSLGGDNHETQEENKGE